MLRSGAPVTREPPSADASDAKTIRIESRVRGRSLLLLVLLTLQLFHAVESQTVRHAEKESVKPKFVLSDIDTTCPTGWERQDASCYRLYSMERSWPQALAFCSRWIFVVVVSRFVMIFIFYDLRPCAIYDILIMKIKINYDLRFMLYKMENCLRRLSVC